MICLSLGLPSVQQKIKEIVLQEIMKKTENRISIGNLRFYPFNRLHIEEVYTTDLKNDTLFYAEKITAGFDFFKLIRNQFEIQSVEIDNFYLNISQDSLNAPFNFQFLIDAFDSGATQPADSLNLQLAINRIMLNNGRLRYDVISEPFEEPGIFDFNHVNIKNLQLNTRMKLNNFDDWRAEIINLTFEEKSGFTV